jgi:uncharacterized protein (DUF3820 family)
MNLKSVIHKKISEVKNMEIGQYKRRELLPIPGDHLSWFSSIPLGKYWDIVLK